MRNETLGNRRIKKMNQRQRKKHCVGEFAELGFVIEGNLIGNPNDEGIGGLIDELIEFIESLNLHLGGGISEDRNPQLRFYIAKNKRGSASAEQRQKVMDWLMVHPILAQVKTNELGDTNY
jgi:uncharacterized protein YggL (DUF469 family)